MLKKGIILAAGEGTRMHPITKAIPKTMLPIGNKASIQWIVDEFRDAGIDEIAIVTGHQSQVIEEYFKDDERVYFIHQNKPYGSSSEALKKAKVFTQNDPFLLAYGDVILSDSTLSKALISIFEQYQSTTIGLGRSSLSDITQYCEVKGELKSHDIFSVSSIVEKPTHPISDLYALGRFVVTSDIYSYLNVHSLTEALDLYAKDLPVFGHITDETIYDIGVPDKYIHTFLSLSKKQTK